MYKRAYEKPDFEEVKMDVVLLQNTSGTGGGNQGNLAPEMDDPEF